MPTVTASPTIADQLRAAIAAEMAKGTSLREIARRADVAPTVISKLMQGKSVYVETAEALLKALGVKALKL